MQSDHDFTGFFTFSTLGSLGSSSGQGGKAPSSEKNSRGEIDLTEFALARIATPPPGGAPPFERLKLLLIFLPNGVRLRCSKAIAQLTMVYQSSSAYFASTTQLIANSLTLSSQGVVVFIPWLSDARNGIMAARLPGSCCEQTVAVLPH